MCSEDLISMFTQHTDSHSTRTGHINLILTMSTEIQSQLPFHDLVSEEWTAHCKSL